MRDATTTPSAPNPLSSRPPRVGATMMALSHHHHHSNGGGGVWTDTEKNKNKKKSSSFQRDCSNASKGSFGLQPQSQRRTTNNKNNNDDSVDGLIDGAPSSVHLPQSSNTNNTTNNNTSAYSLTRELSDLSGSYYNGPSSSTSRGVGGAPVLVSPGAVASSWRQAQVLSSSRLPQHPQPYNDDNDGSSVGMRKQLAIGQKKKASAAAAASNPSHQHHHHYPSSLLKNSAIVERGEVIEVCIHETAAASIDESLAASTSTATNNNTTTVHHPQSAGSRTPLLILLMDPHRKVYELAQVWMDRGTDTVREILSTVNRNLEPTACAPNNKSSGKSPQWKQDYDGLFQVRNNHFSQLIHVLPVAKYNVVPGEVWVGKPWSMSAKQTVSHASTCLNHLKEIGLLQYRRCNSNSNSDLSGGSKSGWRKALRGADSAAAANSTTVLVLSQLATQRIYVGPPGIILKHHHACQFLAFVPPFEKSSPVVNGTTNKNSPCEVVAADDCALSAASGLSDSHCSGFIAANDDNNNNDGDGHPGGTGYANNYNVKNGTTDGCHADPNGAGDRLLSSREDQHDFCCNQSETEESTYSTAGSGSPIVFRKASSSDASAVTKESSYMLRPNHHLHHSPPLAISHRLPSFQLSSSISQRDPPPNRGIVRLLAVLNCAKPQQNQHSMWTDHQQYRDGATMAKSPSSSSYCSKDAIDQRRSSAHLSTTRTTRLSDSSSINTNTNVQLAKAMEMYQLKNHHPNSQPLQNHHHQHRPSRTQTPLYPLWEEDCASQSSGVPLLRGPATSVDWMAHKV